ncbi:MAG: tRNA (adenosine(37)-N6)-threonylcarbamoyltransferase complex dimerization subunit type 1 TsaB [Turicibacter sp.]|nr:tRNA (adenosine(37)-N6)-threonylcarbamoyltransferase complex dimerization subunit type 1 TsaB [Turicibacter sp.]
MCVLAIDTSNKTLSVALVQGNDLLGQMTEETKNNHSVRLMPVIEGLFLECALKPENVECIVVAEGPGSYTGIRIGVTIAKTLAWTLNVPLIGVSSLGALARNLGVKGHIVPLFDARRGTAFAGVYDSKYKAVIQDGHYLMSQLLEKLPSGPIHFIGDVDAHREAIVQAVGERAIFHPDKNTAVAFNLAQAADGLAPVADVHQFSPNYLRLPEAEANWLMGQANG